MPTPTSSPNRPAFLSARDHQPTFADRLWYLIGGGCALLIVASLWITDVHSATKTLSEYRDRKKNMKETRKELQDLSEDLEKETKGFEKDFQGLLE